MANQADLFAPPSDEELFAPPPASQPIGDKLFAPPSDDELFAPPGGESTSAPEQSPEKVGETPDILRREDFAKIASKYGVDANELRNLAPYYGAKVGPESIGEAAEFGAKGVAGYLGRGPALGVPQFLYKKAQEPGMRKALDEINSLASDQRSYVEAASEFVAPGGAIAAGSKKALARIAGGAATGAIAGGANSSEGKEIEGATTGALLGTALTGGLEGVRVALARKLTQKAGPAEKEFVEDVIKREGPQLDKGTEEVLAARKQSEEAIERIITEQQELDQAASKRIVDEHLEPEQLSKLTDASSEEGQLMRSKVEKTRPNEVRDLGHERAIENQLAEEIVETRARDFAEELTGTRPPNLAEARESIAEHASRQGEQATDARYKLFVEEQAAKEYITKNAIRGGRGDNFQDRALNFMSDAQFVLRDIDEKMGTKTEEIHRALNKSYNRMSYARNEARTQIADIYKATDKATDNSIINTDRIYKALDSGSTQGLTQEEQKAASQFREYFDGALDYVNRVVRDRDPTIAPLSIPKMENYVPHMLADTPVLARKVEERVSALKETASQIAGRPINDLAEITPKEWAQLKNSIETQELIQGLNIFDNKPINSAQELSSRLKDTFESRDGRIKMETTARAALERQGMIPEWMRETNLYKLADRWSTNTFKHLYLRQPMDQLGSIARRLDKAGADLESRYIKNLLMDLNGIRKGTMAERSRQIELGYQKKLDQLAAGTTNPVARGALAVAKAVPDVLQDINRQIYPNLLGLNPKALLMNATQVWAKTAPELGNAYGYTTVLRATAKAVMEMAVPANRRALISRMEQQGFVPADFVSKYRRSVADGIRRSALYALPSETLQSLGNASMYLFTKMDMMNRAIAISTGDMMAHDLAKGSKLALRSLQKFPTTVRNQIARAGGDQAAISHIIGDHLNASTQYNYNRMSMSEWGRTMGPLFSTFSKWPTATAGEIVQEFRDKGAMKGLGRNLTKYAAPFALFQMMDYLIYKNDPDQMTDRQQKLLGKGGLSQSAPIGSLEGIIKGDFFTPPAVDAVVQTLLPMLNGENAKVQKGLIDSIQKFTPGSVYVRFVTDDLLTLLSGRRPQGSDFLERSAEGARRITK